MAPRSWHNRFTAASSGPDRVHAPPTKVPPARAQMAAVSAQANIPDKAIARVATMPKPGATLSALTVLSPLRRIGG
jgi:hypothetical protein